jgi:polyisoprenoid-binding protein YceI
VTVHRFVLLLALLWASLLALNSLAAQMPALIIPDATVLKGSLSFDARASAGNFTGTTSTVAGEMKGGELGSVRGWVEAPVRTLATGNARRDRDLNKSMESDKYPRIRFELTNVAAPQITSDSFDVILHGRFIIHGVTREAAIPATVTLQPAGLHVRGETRLNLKHFKIGGLSKALGMLKMHEEILVHIDLAFGAVPGPSSARPPRSPASYTELPVLTVDRRTTAP